MGGASGGLYREIQDHILDGWAPAFRKLALVPSPADPDNVERGAEGAPYLCPAGPRADVGKPR